MVSKRFRDGVGAGKEQSQFGKIQRHPIVAFSIHLTPGLVWFRLHIQPAVAGSDIGMGIERCLPTTLHVLVCKTDLTFQNKFPIVPVGPDPVVDYFHPCVATVMDTWWGPMAGHTVCHQRLAKWATDGILKSWRSRSCPLKRARENIHAKTFAKPTFPFGLPVGGRFLFTNSRIVSITPG